MRKLLVVSILLCALRLSAVEWPYIGSRVESNGFLLKLTLSTSPDLGNAAAVTNLGFFNGFGTNNSLTSTTALQIIAVNTGWNAAGSSQAVARTIYGTIIERLPYPLPTTNNVISENVTNVTLGIHLSDYVYSNESLTISALSGCVKSTNGSAFTNSTAFTGSVTNGSTNALNKVIAAWSNPGFQVITGSTYQLSVVAFQADARNGQPVACVRFWNEDSAGNRTTTLVSQATWSSDGVVEYIATMDASTMTQGAIVTNNFIAYPWVGVTPHVSADFNARGSFALTNSVIGSSFYLCDKDGTYGHSAAAVDGVNGNNTTGVAITNQHFSGSTPPAPFLTIGAAHNAIAASNNIWYGRNDAGYGEIYLTNGIHTFAATTATGNRPNTWTTVRGWPGSDRSLVIISNAGTDQDLKGFVKLVGVTVTNTGITFVGLDNYWGDDVVWDSISSTPFNTCTNVWHTRSKIIRLGAPNVGSGVGNFRNCEFAPGTSQAHTFQLFLGNWQTSSTPNAITFQIQTASVRPRPVCIYAFNRMYCQTNNTTPGISFYLPNNLYSPDHIGCAFVQNVIESLRENGGAIAAGSADSLSTNTLNFLCWNNTTPGQKANWFYTWNGVDGSATTITYITGILNNLWEEHNIKSDDYVPGPNSANIGNWGPLNGVGNEGNFFPEVINIGAPGSFLFRFSGMNTWQAGASGTTNTYTRFTDRQAYAVTNDFGNGNYRLLTDSPAFRNIQTRWVLPFDIEGKSRSAIDPPGAYVAGNAKKGAMF